MDNPKELRYSKDHEWVKVEGNKATIGITDHAQGKLGDVVFVELPEIDAEYSAHDAIANLESVKAVSEVFSPISGKVIEVNQALEDSPDLINKAAFTEGWIVVLEMSDPGELDQLLAAEEYGKFVEEED